MSDVSTVWRRGVFARGSFAAAVRKTIVRRHVLWFVLAACAPASSTPEVTLPKTVSRPTPAVSGSLLAARPVKAIAWQWSGDEPGFGSSFYKSPRATSDGSLHCAFSYDDGAGTTTTACASSQGELWHHTESHAFVADAALALDRETLYSARFSDIATGCTLYAFDARTGAIRWQTRLVGAGEVAHSEYLNSVQLRVIDGRPVVFGWESAARYVEALDPATGEDAYHVIVK